jgi:hypothetical protein
MSDRTVSVLGTHDPGRRRAVVRAPMSKGRTVNQRDRLAAISERTRPGQREQ